MFAICVVLIALFDAHPLFIVFCEGNVLCLYSDLYADQLDCCVTAAVFVSCLSLSLLRSLSGVNLLSHPSPDYWNNTHCNLNSRVPLSDQRCQLLWFDCQFPLQNNVSVKHFLASIGVFNMTEQNFDAAHG